MLFMAQPLPEVAAQGITPNRLYRAVGFVSQIVLAAAGGLAKIAPIGGLVAGSFEQVRIDKSLKPVDGMGINVLPFSAEGTSHAGEQM